jgi:deoxyribose-phosphate aldolase
MSVIKIASYIDHTLLKPTATHIDINKMCNEALVYGFAAVCVPPPLVRTASSLVQPGTGEDATAEDAASAAEAAAPTTAAAIAQPAIKVATVIGFPFGYSTAAAKLAEIEQAIADGADELDIVINLVALREGYWDQLEEEMRMLTLRAHTSGKLVKVIIESGILTDEEIIRCCSVYSHVGVDFLKTSTGYAEKGASLAAVQLMRQHLPQKIKIKASGGIRDYAFAAALIEAGADRLGCSASVEIVKGEHTEPDRPGAGSGHTKPGHTGPGHPRPGGY